MNFVSRRPSAKVESLFPESPLPYIKVAKKPSLSQALFPRLRPRCFTTFIVLALSAYQLAFQTYAYTSYEYFGCALFDFGALYPPTVHTDYQFYRFLASIYQFNSIYSFLPCMLTFLMFAQQLQHDYGRRIWFIYLDGALLGLLLSSVTHSHRVVVGGSALAYTMSVIRCWNCYQQQYPAEQLYLMLALAIVMMGVNSIYLLVGSNFTVGAAGIIVGLTYILYERAESQLKKLLVISTLILLQVILLILLLVLPVPYIDITLYCN